MHRFKIPVTYDVEYTIFYVSLTVRLV